MPQMIIANRLRDGVVVFLAHGESWEPAISAGALIDSDGDAAALMARFEAGEALRLVVAGRTSSRKRTRD